MDKEQINALADIISNSCGFIPFTEKKVRKAKPHIILFRGKRVELRNGKNVWPSLGAAKSAIRDKLMGLRYLFQKVGYDLEYDEAVIKYKELLDLLEKAGILEFKELKQ